MKITDVKVETIRIPHEKALPYCFCGTGSFAECAGEDLHRRRSVGASVRPHLLNR